MIAFIISFLGLFGFWVLLSGKTDTFHLGLGILSALFVAALNHQDRPVKEQLARAGKIPVTLFRGVLYFCWLLQRIVLAAWHVSCVILHPKMPLDPKMIRHTTRLKTDEAKVIFANSITLTPGTITADIDKDEFVIHRLDAASSEDIDTFSMERQIEKLFKKQRKEKP